MGSRHVDSEFLSTLNGENYVITCNKRILQAQTEILLEKSSESQTGIDFRVWLHEIEDQRRVNDMGTVPNSSILCIKGSSQSTVL